MTGNSCNVSTSKWPLHPELIPALLPATHDCRSGLRGLREHTACRRIRAGKRVCSAGWQETRGVVG